MLYYLIKFNGIYDIICALSILHFINIPYFRYIHLSMIKNYNYDNILFERFFGYWIFTYGLIRIHENYTLISYSYYLEALFFSNEYINSTVYYNKTLFVIISSLYLGYLCNLYYL